MSKQIDWFQALVVKKKVLHKVRFSVVHVFLLSALQVPMSQNGLKLLSLPNPWLIMSNLQRHEGDLREDHMESVDWRSASNKKGTKTLWKLDFGWNPRHLWCKILVDLNFSDNFYQPWHLDHEICTHLLFQVYIVGINKPCSSNIFMVTSNRYRFVNHRDLLEVQWSTAKGCLPKSWSPTQWTPQGICKSRLVPPGGDLED